MLEKIERNIEIYKTKNETERKEIKQKILEKVAITEKSYKYISYQKNEEKKQISHLEYAIELKKSIKPRN